MIICMNIEQVIWLKQLWSVLVKTVVTLKCYVLDSKLCIFFAIDPIMTIKSNKNFNTENGLNSTNHGTRLNEVFLSFLRGHLSWLRAVKNVNVSWAFGLKVHLLLKSTVKQI